MAISAINNVQQTPSFRGKWSRTENGTPYYKTNVGTIMGCIGAGMALLQTGAALTAKSSQDKAIGVFSGLVSIALEIGVGKYVDKKRNAKAQSIADYTRKVGVKNAVVNCDDLEISKNNKVYYKSKEGRKFFSRLGAISGILLSMPLVFSKASPLVRFSALFVGAGLGAAGGWLKGWFVDALTNRSARKHSKDILIGDNNS